MDDEDKPKRTPVQPDKLNLPAPRPRNAAPSYPTPAPGGPVQGRPAAARAASTPARDPARQRLEEQAEQRRAALRQSERECREGQGRAHAESDQLHRERLDRAGVSGIQRVAADARHAEGHQSEVAMLDDYFAGRWESLEATIAEAFDLGHFTDAFAAAEDRAAGREGSRDHDGGREIGE